MTRRVTYLTGTRADFGLLRSTLQRIHEAPDLTLELLVTGMHLSATHGRTVDEIRASGLPIRAELPLDMQTRSGASMAEGLAECLKGVTRALSQEPPDLLLLLGDRGEMLAGAIAALHLGVPAVHLHGGERSGSVDEPVRHAISKLSSYHLVATEGSRQRLVAMGEEDSRIHVTGAPGLDGLAGAADLPRDECLAALGLPAQARFILVVFHPVVQQAEAARGQMASLLSALATTRLPMVVVEPNADAGSREVLQALDEALLPAGSRRFAHLPRNLYVAAMRHADLLAGNSSSGILEAATFGTPVVNIGDRQRLRERNANVTDASDSTGDILRAVNVALGAGRYPAHNVYGDGHAGRRIVECLGRFPLGARATEKINAY